MSLFGAIGRTALKALQSNNRLIFRHSPQPPNYVSNRLVNMFGKMSEELANKVPERPKRPQSGYNIFYKDLAVKLKTENPKMKVTDMAKAIAHQWNSLDPNFKQDILEKSKKDNEGYKQQIENWRKSLNENQMQTYLLSIRSRRRDLARRRLKLELKSLDFPIRAKSAFNLFIKESIKNREPTEQPYSQVFKNVILKWNTLTPEEKAPFMEMAKSDKIRYLEEFNKWQENIKIHDQDTLERLNKLRTFTSRTYLNPDLKKEKTKKVIKKKANKPKAKKVKSKTTSQRIKAKPKVSSRSKSTKVKKSKTKKSSKSIEKSSESKAKKTKKAESSGKQESDSSSDE